MSTIEILATIFSLMIITKIVLLLSFPKALLKFADKVFKMGGFLVIIDLLVAGFIGYLLLCDLKIETIMAVMFLASILIGMQLMPYAKNLLDLSREKMSSRTSILKEFWYVFIIWLGIAIWTLYSIFG